MMILCAADEADEEADDDTLPTYHRLLMPELIVSLDADDEFLRQRVMNLPESVIVGTHNTEDGLMRRLADYRAINTEDDTILNYFDELELHPQHISQSYCFWSYFFYIVLCKLRLKCITFLFN